MRRVILDSRGRTPLTAKVIADADAANTIVVVTKAATPGRVEELARRVTVWVAPARGGKIDLRWLLKKLGAESVTILLVEGGGEVNASFLLRGLAQRVAFFYAPKIIGGRDARQGVAGEGLARLADKILLQEVQWQRLGPDWLMTARMDL